MSFQYSPKIVTDGLVLYLDASNTKSYPGSGTVWSDLSRSGNNGTLINGATFNSGNGGNIVFDGVDDYSLGIFTFTKTNIITINLWGKYNTLPNTGNRGLFQIQNGGIVPSTQIKTIGGWLNTQGRMWGRVIDTSGEKNLPQVLASTILTNNWYYFSYVADGSNYKLYINGDFKTQIDYNGTILEYDRIFLATQGTEPSNCNISNVTIYNQSLTPQEVLQNYNATKSRYGL